MMDDTRKIAWDFARPWTVKRIALPGVQGRIDHMAVDVQGQRLFVCALGNNTLEVIDLKKGERVRSIGGLHEPQGVRYLPESNTIVVANRDYEAE